MWQDVADNVVCLLIPSQSIVKEKKIQREYFKTQEAAGKIKAQPPPPKAPAKSAIETVGIPEYVTRTMRDPIDGMTLATRWEINYMEFQVLHG